MPRKPPDACELLHGPYHAPALSIGDRDHCLYRDTLCKVTSWHDALIPWPQGVPVKGRSGPALIVTEGLVRALRCESAKAVCRHFRLCVGVVARDRKAFGVTRTNNPRSYELIACSTAPPRPCQNVACRSFSVTRAGSSPRSPIRCGRSSWTAAAMSDLLVMQLPTPATPSSVSTSTSVLRSSSGLLPWGQPPSTVPPVRPVMRTSTIFIGVKIRSG